jgi:hypothetical protein
MHYGDRANSFIACLSSTTHHFHHHPIETGNFTCYRRSHTGRSSGCVYSLDCKLLSRDHILTAAVDPHGALIQKVNRVIGTVATNTGVNPPSTIPITCNSSLLPHTEIGRFGSYKTMPRQKTKKKKQKKIRNSLEHQSPPPGTYVRSVYQAQIKISKFSFVCGCLDQALNIDFCSTYAYMPFLTAVV